MWHSRVMRKGLVTPPKISDMATIRKKPVVTAQEEKYDWNRVIHREEKNTSFEEEERKFYEC